MKRTGKAEAPARPVSAPTAKRRALTAKDSMAARAAIEKVAASISSAQGRAKASAAAPAVAVGSSSASALAEVERLCGQVEDLAGQAVLYLPKASLKQLQPPNRSVWEAEIDRRVDAICRDLRVAGFSGDRDVFCSTLHALIQGKPVRFEVRSRPAASDPAAPKRAAKPASTAPRETAAPSGKVDSARPALPPKETSPTHAYKDIPKDKLCRSVEQLTDKAVEYLIAQDEKMLAAHGFDRNHVIADMSLRGTKLQDKIKHGKDDYESDHKAFFHLVEAVVNGEMIAGNPTTSVTGLSPSRAASKPVAPDHSPAPPTATPVTADTLKSPSAPFDRMEVPRHHHDGEQPSPSRASIKQDTHSKYSDAALKESKEYKTSQMALAIYAKSESDIPSDNNLALSLYRRFKARDRKRAITRWLVKAGIMAGSAIAFLILVGVVVGFDREMSFFGAAFDLLFDYATDPITWRVLAGIGAAMIAAYWTACGARWFSLPRPPFHAVAWLSVACALGAIALGSENDVGLLSAAADLISTWSSYRFAAGVGVFAIVIFLVGRYWPREEIEIRPPSPAGPFGPYAVPIQQFREPNPLGSAAMASDKRSIAGALKAPNRSSFDDAKFVE